MSNNKKMSYKGYHGSAHYSDADKVFYGKLEYIRSLITYEATDVKGLRNAFEEAVNDYLADCVAEGTEPETPRRPALKKTVKKSPAKRAVRKPVRKKQSSLSLVIKKVLRKSKKKSVARHPAPKFAKRRM